MKDTNNLDEKAKKLEAYLNELLSSNKGHPCFEHMEIATRLLSKKVSSFLESSNAIDFFLENKDRIPIYSDGSLVLSSNVVYSLNGKKIHVYTNLSEEFTIAASVYNLEFVNNRINVLTSVLLDDIPRERLFSTKFVLQDWGYEDEYGKAILEIKNFCKMFRMPISNEDLDNFSMAFCGRFGIAGDAAVKYIARNCYDEDSLIDFYFSCTESVFPQTPRENIWNTTFPIYEGIQFNNEFLTNYKICFEKYNRAELEILERYEHVASVYSKVLSDFCQQNNFDKSHVKNQIKLPNVLLSKVKVAVIGDAIRFSWNDGYDCQEIPVKLFNMTNEELGLTFKNQIQKDFGKHQEKANSFIDNAIKCCKERIEELQDEIAKLEKQKSGK